MLDLVALSIQFSVACGTLDRRARMYGRRVCSDEEDDDDDEEEADVTACR